MDISLLVIYTGGTIGMKRDACTGALVPFNFEQIEEEMPELKKFQCKIDTYSCPKIIDSSDIQPDFWAGLAQIIKNNYDKYDGFVVLHGTDTMSYSASALSFMLENLAKPVIFTGSQLPIGVLRTDGKENIISAIEIASAQRNGKPIVPEVCIFFENKLFRGNRTTKHSAENFNAFRSYNYPPLAESGIEIKYNYNKIAKPKNTEMLKIYTQMDTSVINLKIFPGINVDFLKKILSIKGLRGVIIETFGSGNAPTSAEFSNTLREAVDKGLIIINITQCQIGSVDMDKYETGIKMKGAGIISGGDMTFESAITKLMLLLSKYQDVDKIKSLMKKSMRGEIF